MKAMILYEGTALKIYTLNQEGSTGDEVSAFLHSKDPATVPSAKGLAAILQHVANSGLGGLSKKKRDCWKQEGLRFCELKKPPWRFSYFEFGRKVLLATVFRKYKDKPVDEYRRAIRLYETFKANQVWEG